MRGTMRSVLRLALLAVVTAFGCSADQTQHVYIAPQAQRPVAIVDASLLSPVSSAPPAGGNACIMLYECGCNSSCIAIDRPADALHEGMQVGVLSGPLKGTSVFVAKNRTDDGESVFTVQRADPKSPIMVCSLNAPFMGYLCATSNSGAARACHSCTE
jgi:hypothetical protein